ncbi:ankyrin repeat-containing domain protein [Mycena polygramma]|nr:ankyrin repeat-containing domain protein [Mycena polygramma]
MLKTISTRFAGTYIVLDALDECSEPVKLVQFVSTLRGWAAPVHLLVASPPHRIFMETPGFEGASAVALEPIADISVTHTTDIRRLVTSEINLKYKLEHPARCAGDVALKVIEMSHGMFRMAAALLSELTRSSAVPDLGTIPTWRPNELSGFYSRFLEAIGEGGQSFLRHGVGPDKRGEPRRIMLHCAARSGHTDIVYLLLDHGPDVNSAGRNFCSALHLPSEKIVRLLINLGADVNARSGFAYSMLQDVALYDQVNTVRLFEHCANVNAAGASGGGFDGSALQSAAQNGRVDVVRVLFEHGAAVNRVDVSSSVVRSAARRRRRHTGTVRVLFQHGADVKRVDGISGSVLQDAALNGHVDIVCVLLKKGADVHTVDCDGSSALQDAARNGHVGIVCLLLDHDADVSIVGGDFGSALEAASAGGHEEIVKLLREHGAHKGELDGK